MPSLIVFCYFIPLDFMDIILTDNSKFFFSIKVLLTFFFSIVGYNLKTRVDRKIF